MNTNAERIIEIIEQIEEQYANAEIWMEEHYVVDDMKLWDRAIAADDKAYKLSNVLLQVDHNYNPSIATLNEHWGAGFIHEALEAAVKATEHDHLFCVICDGEALAREARRDAVKMVIEEMKLKVEHEGVAL